MSVDPLAEKYNWMSNYQFSSNQVVHAPEIEGMESYDDLNISDLDHNAYPVYGADVYNGGNEQIHEPMFSLEDVVALNGFDGSHGSKDDKAGVDQRDDFDGYEYADQVGQLANGATVVWGAAQLGVNRLRQFNLASDVGEAFGIGTQVAALRLKAFTKALGTLGNRVGIAGYALSALSISSKLLNGDNISTSEAVGFGINTFFAGVAVAAELGITVAFAPEIAVGALIYGAVELGSYAITGQTLEQNIIGK
jgi:hypothetical protein